MTDRRCLTPDAWRGQPGDDPHGAHGTRQCYRRAGCRCVPCRAANAAYEAARPHLPVPAVSADPARSHLLTLQRQGVGYRQAARLTGLSSATVKAIRAGRQGTITPATAVAILGLTRPALAPTVTVNAYEARRKLRTLLQEDFPLDRLARLLGLHRRTLHRHTQGITGSGPPPHAPQMRARTVARVRALFQRYDLGFEAAQRQQDIGG